MADYYENIWTLLDAASESQDVWDAMLQQYSTVSMAAYGALVRPDPLLRMRINKVNGGNVRVPYMNDLASIRPVTMSSNPAEIIPPSEKPTFGEMYVTLMNKALRISQMDMLLYEMQNTEYAQLADPMNYIINNLLGPAWARYFQEVVFSTMKGVVATNVANYSSDATLDISAGAAVDDPKYHIYICGPDVISFAQGNLSLGSDGYAQNRAFEYHRDPLAGNGAGLTSAISRIRFALHPNGYSYTGASDDPEPSDLELAATWTRPWELKNAQRFVTLICNATVGGTANATAANCPSPQTFNNATNLLGDAQFGRMDRIVMHSAPYNYLRNLDLVSELQYSEQNPLIAGAVYRPTGHRIIVSDQVPKFTA